MASDSLRAELMAVPGVASAEVAAGEGSNPSGVKVKLTPDADARRVGAEVQRILATHGMRSRFSDSEPPSDDGAGAVPPQPVEAPPVATIPPAPTEAPPVPLTEAPAEVPSVEPAQATAVEPAAEVPSPVAGDEPGPTAVLTAGRLRSVAVEETSAGLGVIATLQDGRSASRTLAGQGDDMDAAVVAAVAEAGGAAVEPVAVEWMELDDGSVVTVVIRRSDGSLAAGAGVVRIGRAFAVGLAAAIALDA